ncbi:unnamed protein product [Cylindrotheca closterium]|uniref:Uncharacterized protein n=1 Tax=Cylindrotheca closterium TaxID=2856 RepID=A0AAD2GDB4_9STRA|nr:unnamed protein product [Cylindrotheca closterium]
MAFEGCSALLEADLSTTRLGVLPGKVFADCCSLKFVSLPKSLGRIDSLAFGSCVSLITVKVATDSRPIKIAALAFYACEDLTNFRLPPGSTAEEKSFLGCTRLNDRFDGQAGGIVYGLVQRFNNFPVHRLCYNQNSTTVEELALCIEEAKRNGLPLTDEFGMTPFHILFATIYPDQAMLQVLLEGYPQDVLGREDGDGRLDVEYLLMNWTQENRVLLQVVLQPWVFGPMGRWGHKNWKAAMFPLWNRLLTVDDQDKAFVAFSRAWSAFHFYESLESTSVLEIALWKWELKSGWKDDGSKRQALDREVCRSVCKLDVVIPSVLKFLGEVALRPETASSIRPIDLVR